jgi:hypothetical protein
MAVSSTINQNTGIATFSFLSGANPVITYTFTALTSLVAITALGSNVTEAMSTFQVDVGSLNRWMGDVVAALSPANTTVDQRTITISKSSATAYSYDITIGLFTSNLSYSTTSGNVTIDSFLAETISFSDFQYLIGQYYSFINEVLI